MVEHWEQYEDLEYYPDRVCKCGCGGKIKVRSSRKYDGIPMFIYHHNTVLQKTPRETRICECGCGGIFECMITGKKRFIHGHNNRGIHFSKEHKKKLRESNVGKHDGCRLEETKLKISRTLQGVKKPKDFGEKLSRILKISWQDPEFAKMMIEAQHRKPNRAEKKLDDFLQEILLKEYQINVKAEVMTLGGRCPDFVNVNGQKKIIEMNGDWWHSEKKTGRTKKEEEQQRIDYFAQFGWKTLIVWEHELDDINTLQKKILDFNRKKQCLQITL